MTDPVALVTAQAARSLDTDLPHIVSALAQLGVPAEVVVWDDPSVDWSRFAQVIVRSTWDYPARRDELLAWATRVAALSSLHNPLPLLAWSTDKRYMADLAASGVAVVPTGWCAVGAAPVFPEVAFVLKPAVGAGSVGVARFTPNEREAAEEHVRRLHAAGQVVMIQPYLDNVDHRGETALVFIAGRFSHAVRKSAILVAGLRMVDGLYAAEQIAPVLASASERALADAALAAVPGGEVPLYARVDLVPGDDGEPRLLELELCEPSLFLEHAASATDRLAAAIVALG